MIRKALLLAIGAVALGAVGCSSAGQSQGPGTPATQENVDNVGLPPPLEVPAGNRLTSSLDGSGVQVYQCAKGEWTLLQPAATLTEGGKPVGLHFKGPVWVSTVDGSEVGGVPVATVNRNGAIPELLLKANQNQGQGMFSKVTYVHRPDRARTGRSKPPITRRCTASGRPPPDLLRRGRRSAWGPGLLNTAPADQYPPLPTRRP
jgi:Protein of unknown function (DUF3455)